jgi:glycosyltransferase involved in cell wall biosynthesis
MKKKELQVLYILTKLELGGAQKVCLSLYHELIKHGNRALLVSGNDGALINKLPKNDSIILLENFKREVSLFGFWREIKNFFQLIRLLKQKKNEYSYLIVHTHSTKAGILGRWAAYLAGIRTRIHTVHGFGFHPYQNILGWFINYSLEFLTSFITTHYICVSSYDVKIGLRLLPNFAKKNSIIRASVDDEKFLPAQKTSLEKKHFIFGTISCFKKQKNLFDLLQAFKYSHQKNPHIKLEVIGDGHLRANLEKWIKENNLEQHVKLLGWQENVSAYMNSWDAFVLSSLWEGLPCAIIEARLLKLPVISYDTGGIHDVIMHQENGLLIKPKKWIDLAESMITVSSDKNLYQKLKNYQDNLHDFYLNTMITKHIKLYKSFIN